MPSEKTRLTRSTQLFILKWILVRKYQQDEWFVVVFLYVRHLFDLKVRCLPVGHRMLSTAISEYYFLAIGVLKLLVDKMWRSSKARKHNKVTSCKKQKTMHLNSYANGYKSLIFTAIIKFKITAWPMLSKGFSIV